MPSKQTASAPPNDTARWTSVNANCEQEEQEEEENKGRPLPSRLQRRVVVVDDDLEEETDVEESDVQPLPSRTARRHMVQSDMEEDESDQSDTHMQVEKEEDSVEDTNNADQYDEEDMSLFLADGTVQISQPNDTLPIYAVTNYIRRIAVPSKKVHDALQKYLDLHPADAASTILQLVMHGGDLKKLMAQFHQAMIEYSLEGAIDRLFEEIRAFALTPILCDTRLSSPSTAIPYNGITNTVAYGACGVADLEAGQDTLSRFDPNLIAPTPIDEHVTPALVAQALHADGITWEDFAG
ncbi:hypothetical protein B0H17DRAFT_1199804 [Mycena rosella]|uniref:Uncharacterized protein n=1 Tax=Mycena rosella TaxID=1033263 RepID=A0AAD7DKZ0_MYCRO|nr:hypothetical protein B0H17DRAFT_1199804 [Mycena rosella]